MAIDPATRRALYQNLLLMAYADGKLGPEESSFIEAVRGRANISDDEAAAYRRELSDGDINFRAVSDRESALLIAKAAIGAASSDGAFHRSERYALLELGKAIGLSREELQSLVYDYFKRDVLSELFPEAAKIVRESASEDASIVVISDNFPDCEVFEAALGPIPARTITLREASSALRDARLVFFHLLEDRGASVARFKEIEALMRGGSGALVFIAERSQAYQIGYLLDAGAAACLIAPVYPEEIGALLDRLGLTRLG